MSCLLLIKRCGFLPRITRILDNVKLTVRHIIGIAFILALIINSTLYATPQSATADFINGNRKTFYTKGHPKSKGVDFSISYPGSWELSEGNRPNIVQKIQDKENGYVSVTILAREFPLPSGVVPTEEEQEEFFSSPEFRDMIPENAEFISSNSVTLDTAPAGILEYIMHGEQLGMIFEIHVWSVIFFQETVFVQVGFMVGDPGNSEIDLSRQMVAYKPLFLMMANSIIFPEKYTASLENMNTCSIYDQLADGRISEIIPILIIYILISYVIHLTPSLIIRYVIVKHPISRKKASWLAAGICLILLIVDCGLCGDISSSAQGVGSFFFFLLFWGSRWVMSHCKSSSKVAEK